MMKRILLALIAIPVLWFSGEALVHAFASDETLIRWRIEDMRDSYNAGKIGDVVGALERDWHHEGQSVTREQLASALVGEFFHNRHPHTKQLMTRVDLVEESLLIRPNGEEAEIELEAYFSRLRGEDEWVESWRVQLEADLIKTDKGWRLLNSRHEDLVGSSRGR